jgi:hypothetical protein
MTIRQWLIANLLLHYNDGFKLQQDSDYSKSMLDVRDLDSITTKNAYFDLNQAEM